MKKSIKTASNVHVKQIYRIQRNLAHKKGSLKKFFFLINPLEKKMNLLTL